MSYFGEFYEQYVQAEAAYERSGGSKEVLARLAKNAQSYDLEKFKSLQYDRLLALSNNDSEDISESFLAIKAMIAIAANFHL